MIGSGVMGIFSEAVVSGNFAQQDKFKGLKISKMGKALVSHLFIKNRMPCNENTQSNMFLSLSSDFCRFPGLFWKDGFFH